MRQVTCECYGCAIERRHAGIASPDRSREACVPSDACSTHGRCWTHSEWVDEARCVPPGACAGKIHCTMHAEDQHGDGGPQ